MPDKANPPSPLFKMICLLLKAFKWSSVLADDQIQCLVARETYPQLAFFFLSPEAHISKLSAISCAHTAAFQLKAFCATSGAVRKGKEVDGSG